MQKITTHLWYDTQAKAASAWYVSLFPHSKIKNVTTLKDTPSGDSDMVSFNLAGQDFMAISAGPYFTFNPSISMYVMCESEEEIETLWKALSEGGKIMMPFNTYPWAKKYGWLQDKYGLSWQLSWNGQEKIGQKITPMLMFTKDNAGKLKQALTDYTSIFPNSKIEAMVPYEKAEGDKEGFIKHSRFILDGQQFMAMESSGPHAFAFNEAISFIVHCKDQQEIDYYWEKLSAVPESEQCGWCKDKYGVSWQIVPTIMNELMTSSDKEKLARVTKAFLKMKKFDIETLKNA